MIITCLFGVVKGIESNENGSNLNNLEHVISIDSRNVACGDECI